MNVKRGKIVNIVPARNKEALQSLYIIYNKKAGDGEVGTFIRVYT